MPLLLAGSGEKAKDSSVGYVRSSERMEDFSLPLEAQLLKQIRTQTERRYHKK